jgi:hypothetical protein
MTPVRRRTARWTLITLGVIAVTGVAVYVRNGRAVESYLAEHARFVGYRTGDDPVLRDLAAGRIKRGDSVEELIATYPPDRIVRHANYVTLSYGVGKDGLMSFEGVTVVARNGKLVAAAAWSCTYVDVFFRDESALGGYGPSYEAEMHRQSQAKWEAALAVAGFGATIDPTYVPKTPSDSGN